MRTTRLAQVLLLALATTAGCSKEPATDKRGPAAAAATGAATPTPAAAEVPAAAPKAAASPDDGMYIPGDGNYRVRPPVATAPTYKDMPDPNGGAWRQASWTTRDGVFAVQARRYRSQAEAQAETAAFVPTDDAADVLVDQATTVGGRAGRDLQWRAGGMVLHARFLVDGPIVWKVLAGGKRAAPAGASDFLDSFALRSHDLDAAGIAAARLYDGPAIGPADAPITIAVFQDVVCEYCTRALEALAPVQKAHPGKIRIVFKQLPMPQHVGADLAAEALLAADAQQKFAPLHDALVARPKALTRDDLIRAAGKVGLDVAAFTTALDTHTYAPQVQVDRDTAKRLYTVSTPTLYINGKRMVGLLPTAAYAKAVDEALTRATPGT